MIYEAVKSWLLRHTAIITRSNLPNLVSTMRDRAPKKPRLCLPILPRERRNDNAREDGQGSYEAEATAALGSLGTDQPATITFPDSNVRSNSSYTIAGTLPPQETLVGLQQKQRQQGASADRDFPPNLQVVRGENQGLATGMFCPLCVGDLFQFVVSERRGFVMCPNRQVANSSPVCTILKF